MNNTNGNPVANLYALADCERFPAAQLGEGLVRASTLYWADFTVAERYGGIDEVRDTFTRCNFDSLSYKSLTELACVANHKLWYWYDELEKATADCATERAKRCKALYDLYMDIWDKCNAKAENLPPEQAYHYYAILD